MIGVIMQPTYLPWAGYFNLIARADKFLFLDSVQYSKNSWQNRNRIVLNSHPHWITLPVNHESKQVIKSVGISNKVNWRNKHVNMLKSCYGRHPFFADIKPLLAAIHDLSGDYLTDITIPLIRFIAERLGLCAEFSLASELPDVPNRSKRLLMYCELLDCDQYLSPLGSKEYLEEDGLFNGSEINLIYQQFSPAEYTQFSNSNGFFSHMSIVDVIANIGWKQTRLYIENTRIIHEARI